jgi:hypothetical protein
MSGSTGVNLGAKLAIRKPYLKLIAEGVKAVKAPRSSSESGQRLVTARRPGRADRNTCLAT